MPTHKTAGRLALEALKRLPELPDNYRSVGPAIAHVLGEAGLEVTPQAVAMRRGRYNGRLSFVAKRGDEKAAIQVCRERATVDEIDRLTGSNAFSIVVLMGRAGLGFTRPPGVNAVVELDVRR